MEALAYLLQVVGAIVLAGGGLSLIASVRDDVPGFRVVAAGGLSSSPQAAIELEPFVPAGLIGRVGEALVRLFHALGNRGSLHIQIMWTRDRDVRDRLIDLEKLQSMTGKLLAEHRRDLEGKTPLVFPNTANQPGQFGTAQCAGRHATSPIPS